MKPIHNQKTVDEILKEFEKRIDSINRPSIPNDIETRQDKIVYRRGFHNGVQKVKEMLK